MALHFVSGCAGHNINLVLSNAFADKETNQLPTEIKKLLDTAKHLVTLVKRTKVNHQLTTTLKQSVVTRWNSVLTMLESIKDNMAELQLMASNVSALNRGVARCVLDINEALLGEIIDVLSPFDRATRILSSDTKPTLHLVLPTRCKLAQEVGVAESDSSEIKELKTILMKMLDSKFPITLAHQTSSLLDPRMKNGDRLMTAEQRQSALDDLRRHMATLEVDRSLSSDQLHSGNAEPVRKRAKVSED